MPLDTSPVGTGGLLDLEPEAPASAPEDPLSAHATIGAALQAVRRDLGLTLEEVAERTRVRKPYLEALEAMQLDALPSRPFTVGYIRAYALALGLDPEAAVERFKTDEPVLDEPLRNPIGVPEERDPRVAAFMAGAVIIVLAIVLWNVAQRAMTASAPPPPKAPEALAWKLLAQTKPQPVALGPPLPAPVESTTPPVYETPGLAKAMGLAPAEPQAGPGPIATAPAIDISTLPQTFTPKGKVYDAGNPQLASPVTLQALKSGALILRGPDGSVYFARQLAAGEAARIPTVAGLTIDVSVPHDFQVFVQGQSKGVLPATQVLASKLVSPAAPSAGPVAPVTVRPAVPAQVPSPLAPRP